MLHGRTAGYHFFILPHLIATAPEAGSLRSAAKSWMSQDSPLTAQGNLEAEVYLLGGLELGTCSQNFEGSAGLNTTVFPESGLLLTSLLLKSKNNIISLSWPLSLVVLS